MSKKLTVAAVVIGRNEGQRLVRCLQSLVPQVDQIIYVDSGSSDKSVSAARTLGATVVELDRSVPFTAARARNAGFSAIAASGHAPDYVQFVDGDCSVDSGWVAAATNTLHADPDLGIVTGWRRETNADASIYNAMFEVEWHRPDGLINACGGDMMVRSDVFQSVGGFNAQVIAAEDDEFCIRVRKSGKLIRRLPLQMTEHDANMTRFSQWWQRTKRSGHGFAQVGHLHPEHFVAERRRVWFYGAVLPLLLILSLAFQAWWVVGLVVAIYAISFMRTVSGLGQLGVDTASARRQAVFLTLSKFPNLIGMVTYWKRHLRDAPMTIIEYKRINE